MSRKDATSIWNQRLSRLADRAEEEGLSGDHRRLGLALQRQPPLLHRPGALEPMGVRDRAPGQASGLWVTIAPSQQYWAQQEARDRGRSLRSVPDPGGRHSPQGVDLRRRARGHRWPRRDHAARRLQGTGGGVPERRVQRLDADRRCAEDVEDDRRGRRRRRTSMRIAEEAYAMFCERLAPGLDRWESSARSSGSSAAAVRTTR